MADFAAFERRMAAEGLPPVVIRTFQQYYEHVAAGVTGMIPESAIEPVRPADVAEYEALAQHAARGARALRQAAVLKLNGGLGTSMGLDKAKSLIIVKDGLNFLDCAIRQVQALRARSGARVPFLLMNSFATDRDTCAYLERYPGLSDDLPVRFLQHKFPKVLASNLSPVSWPAAPRLEWNPPGHGDIYTALVTSGMLDRLLAHGVTYVFISNSDNLGAVLDPAILGYFAERDFAFMMEVAIRTDMDRKGGHLARRRGGGFLLRESAQCPDQDQEAFQDIGRHRYFNTNNLWLNLLHLRQALERGNGVLPLPLIVNPKTVDPRDKRSPEVYQIETAMGAAIAVFDSVGAVVAPRTRFSPVKKCGDLLNVRSDRYVLDGDCRIVAAPDSTPDIVIELDPACYGRLPDFEARFPYGPPSLRRCTSLTVTGDVLFGRDVTVEGDVALTSAARAQARIDDGARLRGELMVK